VKQDNRCWEKRCKWEESKRFLRPQEVVYAVHKGSYQNLGEVFGRLAKWVEENGYEIVGPSITVCYNDPRATPEEELISECQFPMRKIE